MSLLDEWGVSQIDPLATPATSATPGFSAAESGGNAGVGVAPGGATPLRHLATPETKDPLVGVTVPGVARCRKPLATPGAVRNGGNAGVFSKKTQESQESQESQGVH